MAASVLKTEALSFQVGQKELIRNITLDIPKGSFVGLVGPNGSGKSTLLKTIYRTHKASGGAVYLNGQETSSLSNRQVAKEMAVVTQESDITFDFSVMELMLVGRYAHKGPFGTRPGDKKACEEALQKVGMLSMKDRSFLSLSGGEKQRVLIASAFSRETRLIVLDEPTNHLDIGYQFLIMDLMKTQRQATVFTSVHDLNMAMRYCDWIIALQDGEIVGTGEPQKVLTSEFLRRVFRVETALQTDNQGNPYLLYVGALPEETIA